MFIVKDMRLYNIIIYNSKTLSIVGKCSIWKIACEEKEVQWLWQVSMDVYVKPRVAMLPGLKLACLLSEPDGKAEKLKVADND